MTTSLPDLIGHQSTVHALGALLGEGKLPHALLFHGPRGTGKALLARHLAYRLICGPATPAEDSATVSMFGDEPALSATATPLAFNTTAPEAFQLAAGSCPDFHLLTPDDGKKSIGVKPVTAVLEVLRRSADAARVCLIDGIDDLTEEAANMLLKSLEEPRPGIYFLLISHQLSRVLPTIRSRCRLFRLGVLTDTETRAVLRTNAADESLATVAAGCPGLVLGDGAEKRLKTYDTLQKWQRGEGPPPAPSTENLLPALRQLLGEQLHHGQPTLQQAETYRRLAQLAAQQAELNLPAALTHEAALSLLMK